MKQEEDPIRPRDWFKVIPFQAVAASDQLGWVGLEAARYHASPTWEYNAPALTHHRLVLVTRPPQGLELRFDEVKRHVAASAGFSDQSQFTNHFKRFVGVTPGQFVRTPAKNA